MEYKVFIQKAKSLSEQDIITSLDVLEFRRETGYMFTRYTQFITEEEFNRNKKKYNSDKESIYKDKDITYIFKNLKSFNFQFSHDFSKLGFLMPLKKTKSKK